MSRAGVLGHGLYPRTTGAQGWSNGLIEIGVSQGQGKIITNWWYLLRIRASSGKH